MPEEIIINCRVGTGQVVPVKAIPIHGDKLLLKSMYHPKVIDEIKALSGAHYDGDSKSWTVDYNERNLYAFKMINGGNYNPLYDDPITTSITPINPQVMKHQLLAINTMLQRKRMVYAGEMGTGKTLSIIELGSIIGGRGLVSGPKTARLTWERELRKWQHKADITFCPYHKLEAACKQDWDWFVPDESHKIKNPQTQRSAFASLIAQRIRNNNGYIIPMTGSPAPRDPSDWWNQVELCQPGFLRESSKTKLTQRLAEMETMTGRGGQTFQQIKQWKLDEVQLLYRRLSGMVLVQFKKDCLDLPEKTYKVIQLPLTDEVEQTLRLASVMKGAGINLLQQLRQMSDGFSYKDDSELITPKDEALEDILEEQYDGRIVIFAGYHASIDKIIRMCQKLGWHTIKLDGRGLTSELNDPIDKFEDKTFLEPIAFIGQPIAGGISITLTAANTIVYYSNDFAADARIQSEDRIHRMGQGRKCTIIDLCWLPTDNYVLQAVKEKRNLQGVTTGEISQFISDFKRGEYLG